jgi:peroxiredoxin
MNKLFLAVLIPILFLSCSRSNNVKINGKIEGATNGDLVLKVLEVSRLVDVDTLKYNKEGRFTVNVKLKGDSPQFYYLYYRNAKVASMVLLPGDVINLVTDTTGRNVKISGSEESLLLTSLEKTLAKSKNSFDSLMTLMHQADKSGNQALSLELNYALGRHYVKSKQDAIKYIYTNPNSITNVILMYHKLSPDIPLFADVRDVLLFKRVHDSLTVAYPGSVYLERLMDEIGSRENVDLFTTKILDASESGFPDISLPDTKAQSRSLSDLSGKVILLSFWTVTDPTQRMLNREYLELYEKYKSKGFEIYQVSVDTDKTAWATAVNEQKLPWINVCDGLGTASIVFNTYNIQKVPANYLIDKSGTIVARDLFDNVLEQKIASLMR